MHTIMLTLLVEEAMKDNRNLNTFKAGSFATIAQAISVKFRVECCPSFCGELVAYVENYVEYHPDFSKEE